MDSSPKKSPTPSHLPSQLPKKSGFLRTAKFMFWSFVGGLLTGGIGGGYVVFNADRFNIPFLARGDNNTQTSSVRNGNQPGDGNAGNVGNNNGNQAGSNNTGTVGNENIGTNTNTSSNLGIGDINGDNVKIDIKIIPSDPKFQNDKLPGYFPDLGFGSKPPQLNGFQGAEIITRDLVVSGQAFFDNRSSVIRGRTYAPIFYLNGSNREPQRVAFKLNGKQKGALLQFGMMDLSSGETELTYQVNILADGATIWKGRVIYGTAQQFLSVPLNIPNVSTIVIEHIISQGGDNPRLNLIFTRAELLYK
jgi:uncharacterized protein (DUF736 family)